MSRYRSLLLVFTLLLSSLAPALAQVTQSTGRSIAQAAVVLGAPAADTRLERMLLLLKASESQQQALTAKLAALQTPTSASYRHWLTPAAFADAYANSATDVATVAAWLASQGFTVGTLPASRGWIEFSGTAQQVEQAFQSPLALAQSPSGTRVVLTSAISVPAALSPLVYGLVSLDGAVSAPAIVTPQALTVSAAALAGQTSLSQAVTITPKLMAEVLRWNTADGSPKGTGQTIGLAARAYPSDSDWRSFRSVFGLPSAPWIKLGTDQGGTADGDVAAATLMASWAGAAAPQAQIAIAANATTLATDGLDLSLAQIVDQASAQSLVVGYSNCEAALSEAHQAFYAALYRQASAEGITIAAAAGDSGAAACYRAGSDTPVTTGLAVNALASTPWNTAVGAAGIAGTNTSLSAWSPAAPSDPAYASGGGTSTLYELPDWQASIAPSGSAYRILPDLVLPTALDTESSPGVAFCLGGTDGSCAAWRSGGSAPAAALFAGLTALASEANAQSATSSSSSSSTGSRAVAMSTSSLVSSEETETASGGLGNLTGALYSAANSQAVFQDIQQGTAELSCTTSTSGCDSTTGLIGYAATAGYDLATGLGSVNAAALVAQMIRPVAYVGTDAATVEILTSSSTVNPSTSVTIMARVSSSGTTQPTGTVQVWNATTSPTSALDAAVSINATTHIATYTISGGFATGSNSIMVIYNGDTNYRSADSDTLNITAQAGSTSLDLTPSTSTPNAGDTYDVTATVTVTNYQGSANPAGSVRLVMDSTTLATTAINSSGVATFSSLRAPASGQHSLKGTFLTSNSNYENSSQVTQTLDVQKNTGPTLTIASGLTGSAGSTLTVPVTIATTAAAASAGTYPSGTLTVKLDSSQVATQTLSLTSVPSTVNLSVPLGTSVTVGSHTLAVSYDGDTYYATSSGSATIAVGKMTPTVTAAWPSSVTAGTSATVTSTVTGANNTAPTGTVNFLVDSVSQTAVTLTQGGSASSTATMSVSGLTPGTHTLSAAYNGDSNYATAAATAVTISVAKGSTTTTLTVSPTTMKSGTTHTLTATIAPSSSTSATTARTGTVTFYDGTTPLKVVTVSNNKAVLSGVSFTLSTDHAITAYYSGDTNWESSTSDEVDLTAIISSVKVVLTSNLSTVSAGRALILTATVTPTAASTSTAAPTGTVIFYEGTTILGQATLTPLSSTNVATAVLTLNTVSGGTWTGGAHTIYAVYVGDTNYETATSNTLDVTVQDFTISINPSEPATNIDIAKGSAGSVSFTVKSWGGYSGQLQVTCSPTVSTYLTCTPSPQLITPTANVTLTVQTYTTGTGTSAENRPLPWMRAVGGTALAALAFFLLPFGRRTRIFAQQQTRRWLTLLLLLTGLATVGIGCNNVSTVTSQGTPLGVTTLQVVVVANVDNTVVNRTGYFTVNVIQK